jgi:hypothetical protein
MRGGFERFIRDHQVMMFFVGAANALEDLNGLFFRGFVHLHRLEAAFERGIRFDVLAILVQRGRADDL